MADHFLTSIEHVLAELARIDLLVRDRIGRVLGAMEGQQHTRGLFVTEEDLQRLFGTPLGLTTWSVGIAADGAIAPFEAGEALRERNRMLAAASRPARVELRLEDLCQKTGMGPVARDVLLLCLAPEFDTRYARFYGYLHDDVERRRPSVGLLVDLVAESVSHKVALRSLFEPGSPLVDHHLIHLDRAHGSTATRIARPVSLDPRAVAHLLGSDALDRRLSTFCVRQPARGRMADLDLPTATSRAVSAAIGRLRGRASTVFVNVHGASGSGRRVLAEEIARRLGRAVLMVDLERAPVGDLLAWRAALEDIHREVVLTDVVPCFVGFDRLAEPANDVARRLWLSTLARTQGPILAIGTTSWPAPHADPDMPFWNLGVPWPRTRARRAAWQAAIRSARLSMTERDVDVLAEGFPLTGGQIERVVSLAADEMRNHRTLSAMDALRAFARTHTTAQLGPLARRQAHHPAWDDLVLPPEPAALLGDLRGHLAHRIRVFEEWGFESRYGRQRGVTALFAGPSGTGKTMAASALAGAVGVDLFTVDLSSVVSKYIGETEKHLSAIFDGASRTSAILFFDEADALFGKRTGVRDSHDRYANIETSYLLQRMEQFDGCVILATNLQRNMDDAFVRRMTFTIPFPAPDPERRAAIWCSIWPEAVPRDPDLDLDFFAERFELTGGNIRNIALAAAMLAAGDHEADRVANAHVIRAIRRELTKLGRAVSPADFGQYAGLARPPRGQAA